MEVIARIRNDFPTKFGLPRQSGLAPSLQSKIVFEPAYRVPEALRGLDGFSHIWLIWGFSENCHSERSEESDHWQPTVRPPRLGGNVRMGVFATRSPFRPNPIGLSCVRLDSIVPDGVNGLVLIVSGADLMDGTPIYDIKPYIPYTDAHPDAAGGFAQEPDRTLCVQFPQNLLRQIPEKYHSGLIQVLSQDPRPSYQQDGERIYGLYYGEYNIRFSVMDGVLTVCGAEKRHLQDEE